ncbi:unnamed protein product [Caenorhabditis bovis]|uniref:Uncharacterized protein n=1 Tax=Caenorhabditis bovis TaxID=2654633 RepID=A0A8S1EYG1_9PELO|nr:unnamed protein product [Caenorhabditis bovis]
MKSNSNFKTDMLKYATYRHEKSLKKLDELMKIAQDLRNEDTNFVDELEALVEHDVAKFSTCGQKMDEELQAVLNVLFDTIESYNSHCQTPLPKNETYSDYMELHGRLVKLTQKFDEIQRIKSMSDHALSQLKQERKILWKLAERADEMKIRWILIEASTKIARGILPEDPLYDVRRLPQLLTYLYNKPTTVKYYKKMIENITKRVLAFHLKVESEKDPTLKTMKSFSNLTLLDICSTQLSNKTKRAPMVHIGAAPYPTSRDPSNTVLSHGEVTAPPEIITPVAKDSAMTLASSSSPTPILTNGETIPPKATENLVAKDSVQQVGK